LAVKRLAIVKQCTRCFISASRFIDKFWLGAVSGPCLARALISYSLALLISPAALILFPCARSYSARDGSFLLLSSFSFYLMKKDFLLIYPQ